MTNEETIFAEALGKGSAPERSAYLDQACASDAKLRRAVDALLLAHERAGGILEGSPVGIDVMAETRLSSEGVGSTIGPYKLLEQIGGGGMGVVYMAEQHRPVRRKVALKIIKPGMDSGQVIARFEAERQALTMMDHPNIAKVLDAGTTDAGRPYFVMELVKGIPITDYCDQARLTTRERLELFMQVCHAVQHAHQKGVIHRDLKPTNVLVTLHDDKPVPKVIDFGIAKAAGQILTDRTLFTNYAQMLGTPLYMSPEQAQISGLDVDTRSDVYSLGVLLYELLTGTTPFDKQRLREAAYDEMRRIIREEDPPKPSTRISSMGEEVTAISTHRHTDPKHLGQLVHGDLDWIVMKAMEKDRARRYETANGLARDVERHLHDEAVQACPPSAGYRFRKFARRNKRPLAAIVAVALALVIGTGVATWQAFRAAAALKEKEAQSQRAEQSFLRASIAIREVLTKAAMGSGEWSQLPSPLRKRFAEEAIKFYEGLLQEGNPDPSLRYETAVGYRSIGAMHTVAGELPQAEELYRRSITILDRLVTEHPAVPQYRHQLAWSQFNLARTLNSGRRFSEAKIAFQRAADLYEKLVSETPASFDYLNELALCDESLAGYKGVDVKRADDLLSRGIAIFTEVSAQQPDDVVYQERLGLLHFKLGQIRVRTEQINDASASFRTAANRFAKLLSDSPKTKAYHNNLTACLSAWQRIADTVPHLEVLEASERLQLQRIRLQRLTETGRVEEALQLYGELAEEYGKLVAASPSDREYRFVLAGLHFENGQLLSRAGHAAEAEHAYVKSIAVFQRLAEEFPAVSQYRMELGRSRNWLGGLLSSMGRREEAEREHRQAIQIYTKLVELADPTYQGGWHRRELAWSRINLAALLNGTNRLTEAEAEYRAALALCEKLAAEQPADSQYRSWLGEVLRGLGDGALRSGRLDEAEQSCRRALETYRQLAADYPTNQSYRWNFAIQYELLGQLLNKLGRDKEAEAAYRDAQQIWIKLVAESNAEDHRWHLASNYDALGHLLYKSHRLDEAAESYRQALAIWQKLAVETADEDRRVHLAWTTGWLSGLLEKQGKSAEAEAVSRETVRLLPKSAPAHVTLGKYLFRKGKVPDAHAEFDAAVGLDPKSASTLNSIAWFLVTEPQAQQVDYARAVQFAEKGVNQAPQDTYLWNTLGVARYRNDQWKDAIASLEKSMELRKGGDSNDWFFLAMCHWQLGDKEAARKWYDQAVVWMDKNQPKNGELRRFRAEAAELLKITDQKPTTKPQSD